MIGRGVSVVLIVLILCSPYSVLIRSEYQRVNLSMQSQTELAVPSDIEYNSSVSILSDSDFVQQNWPGNGTEIQPYVISNLRLSNTENRPIRIYNTRAYFLMINCVVESLENYPRTRWGKGILLSNVTNGIVESCSIEYMGVGMYLSNANNTIIRNNLIVACDTGISINSLDRCTISNNSIRMGFEGITGYGLRHSNLTESMLVESHIGLYLNAYCINNTISMNHIGWCIEANAKDYGSGNTWTNNSWSDWDGTGPYLIPGSAGSVDPSPSLFDEDVIAPIIEFYHYGGVIADLLYPIYSFTFSANASDATAVDSVSLFLSNGYLIEDGKLVQSFWTEYEMELQSIEGNTSSYSITFECNGTYGAIYYYWANDTLGHSRRSEIDSFSLGYFPWGPWSTEVPPPIGPEYLLLVPLGALVFVWLIRRLRQRNR